MSCTGPRATAARTPLLLLLVAAGCATTATRPAMDGSWEHYADAVEVARRPDPAAVSTRLTPLLRATEGLRWNAAGRILMVTWTSAAQYPRAPRGSWTLEESVWLTPVPELERFCRPLDLTGEALALRLAQHLGLPPDTPYDTFVEMWVDPAAIFRPCPDPEVTDRECQVSLTAGGGAATAGCPWRASLEEQLSGTYVEVAPDHLEWMCEQWHRSYPPGEARPGHPWTGLGYTYDWGAPDAPVGASEYVAPAGTVVELGAVHTSEEYCRRP